MFRYCYPQQWSILLFLQFLGSWFSIEVSGSEPVHAVSTIDSLMKTGTDIQYSSPDSAIWYFEHAIGLLSRAPATVENTKKTASCYIRMASIYNYSGNYQQSQNFDSLAFVLGNQLKDDDILAQATNIKGLLCFNQSNYPEALEHYSEALTLAQKCGNKRLEAMIYTNTAIIYFYQGNLKQADDYFSRTIGAAVELNDSLLLSGSYINRGMLAQHRGAIDEAVAYYTSASEICQKIGDLNGVTLCLQDIGSLYFHNGKIIPALDAFNKSLDLAKQQNDQSNTAKGYHNIGEVYAYLGDYKTAILNYQQSAEIKDKLGDQQGLVSTYIGLGGLSYQRGDYPSALDYYQKALRLSEHLNYQEGIARTYKNCANVYRQTGEYQTGLDYGLKALTIYRELEAGEDLGEIYLIIGSLYSASENFTEANRFLDQSLEFGKQQTDTLHVVATLNEIAQLELKQGDRAGHQEQAAFYRLAFRKGEEAKWLLNRQDALLPKLETLKILKHASSKLGEYQQAFNYAEQASALSDSLLNKEKEKFLILAETKWQVGQSKKEVELLEQMHDKISAENKYKTVIIVLLSLIAGLTLVISVFFMLYIGKKRKEIELRQINRLVALRMKNIRNRMSSHFFFNVLNSIGSYEPGRVRDIHNNLSLLLRKSIENIDQLAVSLQEEIQVVEAFVRLQQLRIAGHFEFDVRIDQSVDRNQLIPAMLIQIPVENALKHGLLPLEDSKKLVVTVQGGEQEIWIKVADNGIGLKASSGRSTGTGTGLKVLLEVLNLLNTRNKEKIHFQLDDWESNSEIELGTVASIRIPYDYNYSID